VRSVPPAAAERHVERDNPLTQSLIDHADVPEFMLH